MEARSDTRTPGRRSTFASLRPLRRRDFALLWSGNLVSTIGSWMQTVAVGALVTAHTGKATWAVVIAAGAFLPIGILAPVGGALADRLNRKRVLIGGNLAQTVLASYLSVLVITGHTGPGLLTAIVTCQGSVQALISPFQQAILRDLVPPEEILAAASLGPAQFNVGRVIGPALAGAAIAVFGYPVAFVANAISFLAVVVALSLVRLRPPARRRKPEGLFEAMRGGARVAWAEPGCHAAIVTIGVVAFLAAPFIALIPAVALHLTHGSSRDVAAATGTLTTAQGIGAILGALALAPLATRFGRGRVLTCCLCLLPVVLVGYAFAGSVAVAAVAIGLVGLVYLGTLSSLSAVVQLRAPASHRARVISFYLVALGVSYPIGALLQGPLADAIGLRATIGGSALLLAFVLGLGRLLRPQFGAALTEEILTPNTVTSAGASSPTEPSTGTPPPLPASG